MRIDEERITLKDGRCLLLRSAEEKDAELMMEYLMKTAEETHYLLRYPDEIHFSIEQEKQIIRNILASDNTVWFTVFDGNKAVGNCSISWNNDRIKIRHRCDLAIALEQKYCGCGLGTLLLERACTKAKSMGLEQIELGVYADNERGIALYKKMGFEEYGRIPRAFRLKDGTYIDEINMVRFI